MEKYQRATDMTQTQQYLERLGKLNLHSLKKKKKKEIIGHIKVLQATSERRKSCRSLFELGCMNVINKEQTN